MPTLGHYLVNDVMPEGHVISGPMTKRSLHDAFAILARENPEKYVPLVGRMKARGDEIATLEGISVGLDDIMPDTKARDAIMKPLSKAVDAEKDQSKKEKLVVDAQTKLLALTREHPGSMTAMAASGARGNMQQLMKIVTTPLAASSKNGINPWLIKHSYSEGLTPSEYWITTPEARANNVATVVSVAAPGEMTKVLVANMTSKHVTETDCGTQNGLPTRIEDSSVLDRYLAHDQKSGNRNTLVTPQLVQAWKHKGIEEIVVRSPMTCASNIGVCQHCWGLDEKGKLPVMGCALGVRSAEALSEPLTQMALSSKHAVLALKERKLELTGFKGVRQLLEVPKNFIHEAVLAPSNGTVGHIEAAPQGGHYIMFEGDKLYTSPELRVLVNTGDTIEAGDALTDGVPNPQKVVAAKGIGAGRRYFVDTLHKLYTREGVPLDRRHMELLAKSEISHVQLLEHDPSHPELLKGDVVDYTAFREAYGKDHEEVPINEAIGRRFGTELLHHTVGSEITPSIAKELKHRGITEISVLKNVPQVAFIQRSFITTPLLEKDWIGRLAHRGLKTSLETAAHEGQSSDIHGLSPIPAFAVGAWLHHGPGGTY